MARLVNGPRVTRVISPGRRARLVEDDVDAVAVRQRLRGRRQLGVTEALRTVRLGRRLERPDERRFAADRDLDVGPARELEDGARVDRDLPRIDVARDAGDRDEVGIGRAGRVEQGEAVVDAGVDVEDQRRPAFGHGVDASRAPSMARATASSGVMVSTSITIAPRPAKEGLAPCGLLGEEGLRRITVRRPVILGREALGEHGRRSAEPDDRDVRRGQRGPALRDIDHARRRADDVPLGRRQRVHQCGRLAAHASRRRPPRHEAREPSAPSRPRCRRRNRASPTRSRPASLRPTVVLPEPISPVSTMCRMSSRTPTA